MSIDRDFMTFPSCWPCLLPEGYKQTCAVVVFFCYPPEQDLLFGTGSIAPH